MGEAVIQVEKLSKRFHIGKLKGASSVRDALTNAIKAPFRRRDDDEDAILWALRDVSFEVKHGEVLGLIGRNGAGKSTLLKILARITRPTEGWAEIKGRIGSLLEVGTGFHPELTGRENIFLSGAVLGMKKEEIRKKFDEIVAFSEIERFLDTPLKHYSSGMQMRLAFAVAAHLEPEILLVDEVLAVGDASFQRKCLGKMGDVARHGRTILFVSHSMAAVTALCPRVIMLRGGQIALDGPSSEVTGSFYAEMLGNADASGNLANVSRAGTGKARFTSISLQPISSRGSASDFIETGCDLVIQTAVQAHTDLPESNVAVIIYDSTGYRLVDVNLNQHAEHLELGTGDTALVRFHLRQLLLKPGTYTIGLWIGRGGIEETDAINCAATFSVAPNAESQVHSTIFPGPYLCNFESSVSREVVSV